MSIFCRRGVTLVELLVVMTILGVLFAIAGLNLGSLRATNGTTATARLAEARDSAIVSGHDVTTQPNDSGRIVRFRPDGQAIGPGVDPLSGAETREDQQ